MRDLCGSLDWFFVCCFLSMLETRLDILLYIVLFVALPIKYICRKLAYLSVFEYLEKRYKKRINYYYYY